MVKGVFHLRECLLEWVWVPCDFLVLWMPCGVVSFSNPLDFLPSTYDRNQGNIKLEVTDIFPLRRSSPGLESSPSRWVGFIQERTECTSSKRAHKGEEKGEEFQSLGSWEWGLFRGNSCVQRATVMVREDCKLFCGTQELIKYLMKYLNKN